MREVLTIAPNGLPEGRKLQLTTFEIPDTVPALLSANFESPGIVLASYVDSMSCSNKRGIIYCNLENDIIYLENVEQ